MSEPRPRADKSPTTKLHRRQFLGTVATAGTAAMVVPTIIPASALGRSGSVAPSERIVMGGLGVNPKGRGGYDLSRFLPAKDVQFVAICDAQKTAREGVKAIVDKHYGNSDCKMYRDMREYLAERSDIDAILMATGDRWHALASLLAMRAGKDVYTEKPSCMTIAEGQQVVATAKRYQRVYQTGTQRLSEPNFVFIIQLALTGKLGKVHTARAHIAPWDAAKMITDWLPAQPEPAKEDVDYDEWLGPCPWRPYNANYVRGAWRGHYDFHTSCIGEWGAHTFAQAQAGIGAGKLSPISYQYVDNPTGDGMVTTFANGVKMVLQREGWKGSCGMRFEGDEGWATCADGYKEAEVSSPSLLAEFDKVINEYKEKTGRSLDHWRNFLDCVKSRQETVANPEVMHHSMCTVHAANICMWLGRDMKFDPAKEEFVNDAEANRLRSRAQREPWIY